MRFITAILLTATLALAGCAETLHKPTTVGNTGTSALVAYFAANRAAVKYIEMPRCATPAVQPCSTQAVVDKVALADTAAYNAAKAADAAAATAADKQAAQDKLKALQEATP